MMNPYDVARFRRVIAGIKPEEFCMDHWAVRTSCGTTACLASHVVLEAGYELDYEPEGGANSVIGGHSILDVATILLVPTNSNISYEVTNRACNAVTDIFFFCADSVNYLWDAIEGLTDGQVTRCD